MYLGYESQNTQGLAEIQRAQKTLDDLEQKMKAYKYEKQIASKYQTRSTPITMPYDLPAYLKSLISKDNEEQFQDRSSLDRVRANSLEATTHIKSKQHSFANLNQNVDLYRKTEKSYDKQNEDRGNMRNVEYQVRRYEDLDLRMLSEKQLEKSQLSRLQKIEGFYQETFQQMDRKIQELERKKEKIRKDKLLLRRDNQQLERKIEEMRKAKLADGEEQSQASKQAKALRDEIAGVLAKISKLEVENAKIISRNKQLQISMRACLQGNKAHLASDIGSKMKKVKSKSAISRCPYH